MGYLLTKVKYTYSTRKKSTGKHQTGPRHIYSSQSPFLVTQFMVCHQIVNHYMMGRETVPRSSVLLSSVTQSCLILCDPMDCSMPGLPIHHQLLEFNQTHVHRVIDDIQPSHPPSFFSSYLQSFPASTSFTRSQLFASGARSIGVPASASVLPMNIQDLFPLGLTDWISLQSKGLSRVFSNTTVQKHKLFSAQLSL